MFSYVVCLFAALWIPFMFQSGFIPLVSKYGQRDFDEEAVGFFLRFFASELDNMVQTTSSLANPQLPFRQLVASLFSFIFIIFLLLCQPLLSMPVCFTGCFPFVCSRVRLVY